MSEEPGITVDDLPAIYREGYLHAIESARALHDPATDWEGFREYLWNALTQVFGLEASGHAEARAIRPAYSQHRTDG